MKHKKNGLIKKQILFNDNNKTNIMNIGLATGIDGEIGYITFYNSLPNSFEQLFANVTVDELIKLKNNIEEILLERNKTLIKSKKNNFIHK